MTVPLAGVPVPLASRPRPPSASFGLPLLGAPGSSGSPGATAGPRRAGAPGQGRQRSGSAVAAHAAPRAGRGDGTPWGCAALVTPGEKRGLEHIWGCPWRGVQDFLENGQEGVLNGGRRDGKSGEKVYMWQRAS